MSKEILFRGKTEKGKWIEGFYTMLDEDGDGQWVEHYILTGKSDKFYGSGTCRETFEKAEVLPETVGQFTGLLDKNGKKIFQGDVVGRSVHPLAFEWPEVFVVVWAEFGWMKQIGQHLKITRAFDWYNPAVHTVLGNVYDNPELLENTK